MTTHSTHSRRFLALAEAFGPAEGAALARTIPSLETDELARILLITVRSDPRSPR